MGGRPGLVVMGGDSCSKGHDFKSRHRILDGHFFTYPFVVKFVMCVWKDENKWERGQGWPIFRKLRFSQKTTNKIYPTARWTTASGTWSPWRASSPPSSWSFHSSSRTWPRSQVGTTFNIQCGIFYWLESARHYLKQILLLHVKQI